MAKFNRKPSEETTNAHDYPAYRMEERERLVSAVLTTLFGEPKFYGATDGDIVVLATKMAARDPDFLYRLACYARNEGNLRSVSHVLTCVIAREARKYTRQAIRRVVVRPDDITEIMSCYRQMYGKPFPNALKREMAQVIQRFDEYGLAKYNGGNQALRFRDVLRITHPHPKDVATAELFRKVAEDRLETPYTWETELSARGNTREVWDELIASGKVGYMALLRNLRNIVKCGADLSPVLSALADPTRVRESRQLPFRFFSAYRTLEQEDLMTPEIHQALETAIGVSVERMETIPGRTLIAVDVSGSMGAKISNRSTVTCADIARVLAALSSRVCEDGTVCYFDCDDRFSCTGSREGYKIVRYGKFDSILVASQQGRFGGGGTDMSLPMIYALEHDASAPVHPFDRVIYFSDNVCNSSRYGLRVTVQKYAEAYRQLYNPDFWVHGVDLQGYGTQQFLGERFNLIAGWSENVLSFINLAERGIGTLVQAIAEYTP